jgi:hypothetical protein
MSALLYGAAQAAPHLINAIGKWKNPAPQQEVSSDTTNYLNRLRQMSKEGMYGGQAGKDILNVSGQQLRQGENLTNASLRGNAVATGTEGSGVLAQQLLQSGGQTTLAMARIAKNIAIANEQSKLTAQAQAAQVGQGVSDINYQNALTRRENELGIISDVGQGFSAGVAGYTSDMGATNARSDAIIQALFSGKNKLTPEQYDQILAALRS